MKRGGIVLCGGKSTRMGRDKATLPFGPELMLERVVRLPVGANAPGPHQPRPARAHRDRRSRALCIRRC